jgi:hypothetical protein
VPTVIDGGIGTGVNPGGKLFPLVKYVDVLYGLLCDMYISHPYAEIKFPLILVYLKNVTQPPTNARAEIEVVDSNGYLVFGSGSATYTSTTFGGRFKIHEWAYQDRVCRLVQHTEQHNPAENSTCPAELFYEADGRTALDERVNEMMPRRVSKIYFVGNQITEHLEIRAGYNFSTEITSVNRTAGQQRLTSTFFSAEPGSGIGRFGDCSTITDTAPLLRKINKSGPDSKGNMIVTANDCLSLVRPGQRLDGLFYPDMEANSSYGFKLVNNCLPCCSCDDFVNTYAAIRKLYDKYKVLGDRTNLVAQKHSENVARWLAQKECRESSPARGNILPYKTGDISGAKVTVGLCNVTGVCQSKVTTDIEFTGPDLDNAYDSPLVGIIHPESVFSYENNGTKPKRHSIGGSWPNYYVSWDLVEGQEAAQVKFDMTFVRGGVLEYDSEFPIYNGKGGDKILSGRLSLKLRNAYDLPKYIKYYDWTCSGASAFVFNSTPVAVKPLLYDLVFKIYWTDTITGMSYELFNKSSSTVDAYVLGTRAPRRSDVTSPNFASLMGEFISPGESIENTGARCSGTDLTLYKAGVEHLHGGGAIGHWLKPFYLWYDLDLNSMSYKPMSYRLTTFKTTRESNNKTTDASWNGCGGDWTNPIIDRPGVKMCLYSPELARTIYKGPIYVDSIIPPITNCKIREGDSVTMANITTVNGVAMANSDYSETKSLMELP